MDLAFPSSNLTHLPSLELTPRIKKTPHSLTFLTSTSSYNPLEQEEGSTIPLLQHHIVVLSWDSRLSSPVTRGGRSHLTVVLRKKLYDLVYRSGLTLDISMVVKEIMKNLFPLTFFFFFLNNYFDKKKSYLECQKLVFNTFFSNSFFNNSPHTTLRQMDASGQLRKISYA